MLSENQITCWKEKVRKKITWKTHNLFLDFKHKTLSINGQKMINNVDKTAFDVSKELNWGNKIVGIVFLRIMCFFCWTFLQKLWNFRRSCQNCINPIQANTLSVAFESFSSFLFLDVELKVSGFWHKNMATAVITASHISTGKKHRWKISQAL